MQDIKILPHKIYIGDSVEVYYTLLHNTLDDDTALSDNKINDFVIDLSEIDSFLQLFSNDMYTINHLKVQLSDNLLQVLIKVTPWHTGDITVEPLDISSFLLAGEQLSISFPRFTVQSLSEELRITEIQPPISPLILPKTLYFLYGTIASGFLAVIILIFLCLKLGKLRLHIKNLFKSLFKSKNYARFLRNIKRLNKKAKKLTVKDFSQQISMITRFYLENHFNQAFSSAETSKIPSLFSKDYWNNLQTEILAIQTIFIHLDYIRFSGDEVAAVALTLEEKKIMIKNIRSLLETFEYTKISSELFDEQKEDA
ncbi:MAG: hypothetical protein ACRC5H_02310 [Treponemataceae bacterium]